MKPNLKYFLFFLALLFIEIAIALFVKDSFIRPFLGDVIVVLLMYSFIKTFFKLKKYRLPIILLIFSFLIEISQYFKILDILGFGNNKFLKIIFGSTFDINDLFCYFVGFLVLITFETLSKEN